MRITQTMMQNNMLSNLFKSQSQMNKYMNQINTGKKIERPSDDPVIVMKGMGYRTEVAEVEQFRRNTSSIWNWMDHSDDVLDKATKAIQRIEYLAVQAANDTYEESQRGSIAEEVSQLKQQLIELGNTKVNGKYIFNGTDLENKPINPDGTINSGVGRDKKVLIEVSKGIRFDVNVSPDDVFDQDLFNRIDGFVEALNNNDQDAINTSIEDLNTSAQKIIDSRAELGARMNRLELVEDRLSHQEIIAKDTMMTNEGVDFEEAVMNLLTQETIHRAALASGSKIIQPSLVDFLR